MTGKHEPEISVGIVSGSGLTFTLHGAFLSGDGGKKFTGRFTAVAENDRLLLKNEEEVIRPGDEIILTPSAFEICSFTLHAVTIGVNFHWQRNEDQTFRGNLKLIMRDGQVTAVNILPVEEYLVSVISSEMSATSSGELLRAHAVISRSWLLAQIDKTLRLSDAGEKSGPVSFPILKSQGGMTGRITGILMYALMITASAIRGSPGLRQRRWRMQYALLPARCLCTATSSAMHAIQSAAAAQLNCLQTHGNPLTTLT